MGVTEAGLMLHAAFVGAPEQERLTAELNPPEGAMVMVEVALLPLATLPEVGERAIVKVPLDAAVMVTVKAVEVEAANPAAPG